MGVARNTRGLGICIDNPCSSEGGQFDIETVAGSGPPDVGAADPCVSSANVEAASAQERGCPETVTAVTVCGADDRLHHVSKTSVDSGGLPWTPVNSQNAVSGWDSNS